MLYEAGVIINPSSTSRVNDFWVPDSVCFLFYHKFFPFFVSKIFTAGEELSPGAEKYDGKFFGYEGLGARNVFFAYKPQGWISPLSLPRLLRELDRTYRGLRVSRTKPLWLAHRPIGQSKSRISSTLVPRVRLTFFYHQFST